jgi:molybdopterin adenylyltransferase
MNAAVLTVSDSAAQGQRQDLSGPAVVKLLQQNGFTVTATDVVPDERLRIEASLLQLADLADLVVTTGGTGLSPRDVTPEATLSVSERLVPGIAEWMRAQGAQGTPYALLSRAVCTVRGRTMLLNLPGSPAGAVESLRAVLPLLPHALATLAGAAHAPEPQKSDG